MNDLISLKGHFGTKMSLKPSSCSYIKRMKPMIFNLQGNLANRKCCVAIEVTKSLFSSWLPKKLWCHPLSHISDVQHSDLVIDCNKLPFRRISEDLQGMRNVLLSFLKTEENSPRTTADGSTTVTFSFARRGGWNERTRKRQLSIWWDKH